MSMSFQTQSPACVVCDAHLTEVHVDVFSGLLMELCAADLFSEAGDADGVTRVELLYEKITAGFDHAVDLIHDGTVHDVNHTLLSNRDARCVREFNKPCHHLKTASHLRTLVMSNISCVPICFDAKLHGTT